RGGRRRDPLFIGGLALRRQPFAGFQPPGGDLDRNVVDQRGIGSGHLYCSESNVPIAPRLVLRHCSYSNSEIGKAMGTMMANAQAARWTAPRPVWSAGGLLRLPLLWFTRFFRRSELAALDIDQMRDCGLDPDTVRREAAKPFWRE